jgi:uncharacterized protein (DUF2267 family)
VVLSADSQNLDRKFSEFFAWARRIRREQILLTAACYALGAALLLLPFHAPLDADRVRWLIPLVIFIMLTPLAFYSRRWRGQDATRALSQMDKALGLEERAVTAWDLLGRQAGGAAAQWVFRQAEDKLRGVDPRAFLPRSGSWPVYAFPALFALWFALLWFDVDRELFDTSRVAAPPTRAHTLREFARDLEEKAKSEGLRESQKIAQELERIAQNNLDRKSDERQFNQELVGAAQKLDALGSGAVEKENFAAAESQQSLKDLKAELEAMKDLMNLPDGAKGNEQLTQQWLDHLASMPQLSRQLGREPQKGQGFGQNQMRDFLQRMEQQTTGELDRRALIDAQQFLQQMMQRGQANQNQQNLRAAGREGAEEADTGEKTKSASHRPGTEPGTKDDATHTSPPPAGGASTQVKGQLGAGESSGIVFKGKPAPGKSQLSQQEIFASYQRQAEQELDSERVPEALKEMIKNYFMSLGEKK